MVAPSLTPLMQRPDVDDPSITDSQVLEPLSPSVEELPPVNDLPQDDVVADALPPLFSFGDKELFNQKLEEKGVEGVTRDVVGIVKQQLPHFNFTYETLKDGSADVLDLIRPTELPTQTRAMSDEAILALFTDLEDYGKYDPPVQKRGPDGSPLVDSEGKPEYESNRYNLSAFAGGGRDSAVDAALTLLGGWQGARTGAALYASRVPPVPVPGLPGKALEVGGKLGAATLGAVVGAGVMMPVSEYVNEWLFEEPDPILVPSLQAAYNAGETAAYGISFLATPWAGTRLASKPLGETFNAAKSLENFKTIASSNFKPDKLIELFGEEITQKALTASRKQAGKGRVRKTLTPDATKGPTAARITDTLFRGGKESLEQAKKNPKTFLGTEAIVTGGMSIAAYNAEKLFPGSEGARFIMELVSAPPSLLLVKPVVAVTGGTVNFLRSVADGSIFKKGEGVLSSSISTEASSRLSNELRASPEYEKTENPEQEIDRLIQVLVEGLGEGPGFGYYPDDARPSALLEQAGSPLAPSMARTEAQLATREKDLAVETEKGREQFIADAKKRILALRQTNTPDGMQLAAAFEQRVVEQEITDTMEAANTKLINAAERLFGNKESAAQDVDLGLRFYDLQLKLVTALKAKRDKLYNAVPDFDVKKFATSDGTPVRQPNSLTIFDVPAQGAGGLKFSSSGATREFNTLLGGYKDDFKRFDEYFNPKTDKDGVPINPTPDIYPVRFSLLREMESYLKSTKAARLKVNPSDSMATHIDSLLKAIKQDMIGMEADGVFSTNAGDVFTEDQAAIVAAYTKAKSFTYGMHNVISRSFVSETAKVNANRGMVLEPVEALDAVKRGDDIPLSRINQMQNAVNFLTKNASDIKKISVRNKSTGELKQLDFDAEKTGSELNEMFELIIRDARKNIMNTTVDKVTGEVTRTVNPKKLEEYKNRANTKSLFAIFPRIARDLESVESAQSLMLEAQKSSKALQNTPEQTAFSWFLQRPESSSKVIAQILRGEQKIQTRKAFQNMVDRIKARETYVDTETGQEFTSDQILDGMRAAISNYAVNKAGGPGFTFSPTVYYDTLFSDIKDIDANTVEGGFRLMDFMKENGIVDEPYVKNLQNAISQMRKVEEGLANKELSGELFKQPSVVSLGMMRVAGSMLAGASLIRFKQFLSSVGLEGFGVGASITAGQEGAQAATRYVTGPETLIVNNMSKMLQDPKLLGLAIKENKNKKELDETLTAMQKLLGGQAVRTAPKIERDITAEESFIRPGEMLDREADYSKQRLAFPPEAQAPAPKALPSPNPPVQTPTPNSGPALGPVQQQPAAVQSVSQGSGPVDRTKFAALFPEDRELLGIGSLMGQA